MKRLIVHHASYGIWSFYASGHLLLSSENWQQTHWLMFHNIDILMLKTTHLTSLHKQFAHITHSRFHHCFVSGSFWVCSSVRHFWVPGPMGAGQLRLQVPFKIWTTTVMPMANAMACANAGQCKLQNWQSLHRFTHGLPSAPGCINTWCR